MGLETGSKWPNVEQFRQTTANFFDSVGLYDINSDNQPLETVVGYIDPQKRKDDNLPAWYALLPPTTYFQSVKPINAEVDKLNDGGLVSQFKNFGYEVVRIDYFSKPIIADVQKKIYDNKGIIAQFPLHPYRQVCPGFRVQKIPEIGPISLQIINNMNDITEYMNDLGIQEILRVGHTDKLKENMLDMGKDLQSKNIKTVFESGYDLGFCLFDGKKTRVKSLHN